MAVHEEADYRGVHTDPKAHNRRAALISCYEIKYSVHESCQDWMLKRFSFGKFSGFSIDFFFFGIYFFIEKGRFFYWEERKRAEEWPARHF